MIQNDKPGNTSLCSLAALFGSLTNDRLLRFRISGANVSGYYLQESVLPTCKDGQNTEGALDAAGLCFTHERYAPYWLELRSGT